VEALWSHNSIYDNDDNNKKPGIYRQVFFIRSDTASLIPVVGEHHIPIRMANYCGACSHADTHRNDSFVACERIRNSRALNEAVCRRSGPDRQWSDCGDNCATATEYLRR
jgi:hypothetical protein